MTQTFGEKWLETVDKRNSVLCAGLDPAEYAMGRGDEGLLEGEDKLAWGLRYVESVSVFCAAVKPNIQYWKGRGDSSKLRIINERAKELGLLWIDDSKLPDIGSTNDAGMFYSKGLEHDEKVGIGFNADAVTIAPYAGNMEEASRMAKARDLGAITICLMSNPEYQKEKSMLVRLNQDERDPYNIDHLVSYDSLGTNVFVPRYIQLAHDAEEFGLDGVVIGAPSDKNHIRDQEIKNVRDYLGDDKLVLLTGVGKQGGEAESIWRYFGKNNVIVNVGRALMIPKGSRSTPDDHIDAAIHFKNRLNDLRKAA